MAYVCKNCGRIVSEKQFKKDKEMRDMAMGCGCLIWIVILLCFVSVILIPIAIILIGIVNDKQPDNECPYCHGKNCLIPDNTPMAEKILKENYSNEEIEDLKENNITERREIVQGKKKNPIITFFGWYFKIILWLFALIIILGILQGILTNIRGH